MDIQFFHYKKHSDTWFYIISAICLGGLLLYILAKAVINNPNEAWKLLSLSPLLFVLITIIRVVIYRQEYEREGAEKTVILNKETLKLTIKHKQNTKKISRSEIGHIKLFESYGSRSPYTDFQYIELVLKTGESIIISDRIANLNDLNVILKGKRMIRKSRFMNRIKITAPANGSVG